MPSFSRVVLGNPDSRVDFSCCPCHRLSARKEHAAAACAPLGATCVTTYNNAFLRRANHSGLVSNLEPPPRSKSHHSSKCLMQVLRIFYASSCRAPQMHTGSTADSVKPPLCEVCQGRSTGNIRFCCCCARSPTQTRLSSEKLAAVCYLPGKLYLQWSTHSQGPFMHTIRAVLTLPSSSETPAVYMQHDSHPRFTKFCVAIPLSGLPTKFNRPSVQTASLHWWFSSPTRILCAAANPPRLAYAASVILTCTSSEVSANAGLAATLPHPKCQLVESQNFSFPRTMPKPK